MDESLFKKAVFTLWMMTAATFTTFAFSGLLIFLLVHEPVAGVQEAGLAVVALVGLLSGFAGIVTIIVIAAEIFAYKMTKQRAYHAYLERSKEKASDLPSPKAGQPLEAT